MGCVLIVIAATALVYNVLEPATQTHVSSVSTVKYGGVEMRASLHLASKENIYLLKLSA